MNSNRFIFSKSSNFQINPITLWLLLGLSIVFYIFFISTYSIFHVVNLQINESNINPWLKGGIVRNKGTELYLMLFSMPVFLILSFLISISEKLQKVFIQKSYSLILYATVLFSIGLWFILTNESVDLSSIFIFLGAILFTYLLQFLPLLHLPYFLTSSLLVLVIFFIGFGVNCLPSVFDYGYLIGPARKILQGENFDSFYMQYNLLSTLIVLLFVKLKLVVTQMYIVFLFLFALWFLFYNSLAKRLFNNKAIGIYFILSLIIVRMISLLYFCGPICCPQTGPWRLDLWVIIVLFIINFGFDSIIPAIGISIIYLLDDVFGFMYLLLYIFSLTIIIISKYKQKQDSIFSLFLNFIPAIVAIIIHYVMFKSLMSPAGKLYSGYFIDFIPISKYSSFWLIIIILPICMYILSKDKQNRGFTLFLFAIACIQLIYFFGRSHDNNLRNISSIFLFILFLSIDKLISNTDRKKTGILLVSVCIGFLCLNYNTTINNAYLNLKTFVKNPVIPDNSVEEQIQRISHNLKSQNCSNVIILSPYEPYINYRLGLKQLGYHAPFYTNLFCDKTTDYLYTYSKKGYRIFLIPDYPAISWAYLSFPVSVPVYNNILKEKGCNEQFELVPFKDEMMELILKPILKQ